jgi:hypothetical protein
MARMDSKLQTNEACIYKTKTMYFEANSEEIYSEAKQQEVPKEEAAAEIFEALKERYGDQDLAVGYRRQPKKRTKDDGGSQNKLAVFRRQITHRAGTAGCKGRGHNGPTVENIRWKSPECKNGIRNRGAKRQL